MCFDYRNSCVSIYIYIYINYDFYPFVISNIYVHSLENTTHSRQHLAVFLQYKIKSFVLGAWEVKRSNTVLPPLVHNVGSR